MRIVAHLPLLLVFAAACAKSDVAEGEEAAAAPDSAARFAVGATEDCASQGTDSARAVCIALRAASRQGQAAKVLEMRREEGGYCIVTIPADPRTLDGMAVVRVGADGRIRGMALSDSVGCEDAQPRGKPGTR